MTGERAVHWTCAAVGILIAVVVLGIACVIWAPIVEAARVWLLSAMGFPK